MWRSIRRHLTGQEGVSLVSAMLALSLLAVFAMVAASLALNERRTVFNEVTHTGAFLSADSGGEAAIAWLRGSDRPPAVDMDTRRVGGQAGLGMDLGGSQGFRFDVGLRGTPQPRPGYDATKFMDFFYDIDSQGRAGDKGESNVGVVVSKLSLMNYN